LVPEYNKVDLIKNYELVIKTPFVYTLPFLHLLQKHSILKYSILTDIICCDYLGNKDRFVIIYHLLSIKYNIRLRVVTSIKSAEKICLVSVVSLYKGSNWLEREVWDMFGIYFIAHPDLKKILTDYTFSWNPLRKDFPLTGYTEIVYSDLHQKLKYSKSELAQEFREFTYTTT
jgi:NADH dehydrogenase (ubiquinone) Fe-S protein 3